MRKRLMACVNVCATNAQMERKLIIIIISNTRYCKRCYLTRQPKIKETRFYDCNPALASTSQKSCF